MGGRAKGHGNKKAAPGKKPLRSATWRPEGRNKRDFDSLPRASRQVLSHIESRSPSDLTALAGCDQAARWIGSRTAWVPRRMTLSGGRSVLDPAPSGGGAAFLSAQMLKKNKELNVFHHVWSHLTTSPSACLSSPSDPRCVQPMLQVRRKKRRQRGK